MKRLVYVLDPYHAEAIARLECSSDLIDYVLPTDPRRSEWPENADGLLIRSETHLTAADFARAKKLKAVVKQGVGVDNIDLKAAKEHGVIVCNTPALNGEAVAELSLTMALCVARRICNIDARIRRGEKVVRSQFLGKSLYRKKIGIIGMGNIGRELANKWAAAMDGLILAYDPYAPPDVWQDLQHTRLEKLQDLLADADVVSLHVPLTNSTRGMIDEGALRIMKRDAILVNCARGGIVHEGALLSALKEGAIWGAGLDAMEVEPPTIEAYGKGLLTCSNLILTPHIGASTIENQSRSGVAAVETLLTALTGENPKGRLV